MIKPVLLIPIYNHAEQFKSFSEKIASLNLPVLVVNDGSSEEQSILIKKICQDYDFMYYTYGQNGGKGKAVCVGLKVALELGYSHVLQIDADGQHDLKDVFAFLELAEKNPDHLINGVPVYDRTAPKSRVLGRKITNFWVAVETCSRQIKDAMCGFRIYPVKKSCFIADQVKFYRMGFDIEIIVRSVWEKIKIDSVPVQVIYPKDGMSHFHMVKDNVKISLLHTFLCIQAPVKLVRRFFKKW